MYALPFTGQLNDVSFVSVNTAYAVGASGLIAKHDGLNWVSQTSGTTNENRKQNNEKNDDDDERESASVQSIGDHRVIDGPYLKIELGPIHGQYTFVADLEFNTILFQSPISGQLIYFYDFQHTNEWINVHDQHNLLGMFVRDIIRQIQGVPKI